MASATPLFARKLSKQLEMLILEVAQKFGPLTQEEVELITAYMAHFRFHTAAPVVRFVI
jgi:hypothetical protein